MLIKIIREPMPLSDVAAMANDQFGVMIKAAVDVEMKIMALGGELHSDEEAMLLEEGSMQQNVWGINIYPHKAQADRVEFDSMINIRPSQDNFSRGVDNAQTRQAILDVVTALVR